MLRLQNMPLDDKRLIESAAPVSGNLRIFSLHLDFPASVRARWAVSIIKKLAGDHWHCSSEMWKIESLDPAGSIRRMLLDEAARADVILIAVSSLQQRETELIHWLESLPVFVTDRPIPGLLIGLFGDETRRTRELDWTVKHFMNCARQTNRDFIWHWMEEPPLGEPEWLTSHICTFLSRKLTALDHHCFQEPAAEFA